MTKATRLLTLAVFAIVLSFLTPDTGSALAQSTLTGDWKASTESQKREKKWEKHDDSDESESPEKAENVNKLYLSFERRTERGGRSNMGSNYDYSELQGLTREQAERGGAVRFSLVREAGTIECEGSFQNGRGSGTFRFTPNQGFVSAMKARGFDFEKEDGRMFGDDRDHDRENRLFAAATLNVTTALADDLLSADFGKLETEDLFKAAIFKVNSKFMREMKESGFPGLGMEELVKARIFKIDASFVRDAARMGFDKEPFESLVKMRIFKVTPAFVAEVRGEGLNDLTIEDLVKMKIFKIDADFIRRARADGTPIEVEELVQRRIGVHRRTRY
ncbi:MAG TPA: hypothetical protein VM914_01310 [Pyrinomonadaceae bacterium]|jgi:hypothetical protein|nr:hypothetical protein [Pyrinomonadaceae bacterium]